MVRKVQIANKQILLTAAGTPPTEFRIWAFGDNETTKGTFKLTSESAALVMGKAADWGNRYSLDYNHALPLNDVPSPEQGIAAGWFDLELRTDGIWAANVEWTPRATEYLVAKEYKYFSPWWNVNKQNEIVEFVNAALTNLPATKDMTPLVASTGANTPTQGELFRLTLDHRASSVIASMSFRVLEEQLRAALKAQFQGKDDWLYVLETWTDHAVFEVDSQANTLFSVNYNVSNGIVKLTSDAIQVVREYTSLPGGKTMKTVLAALRLNDTASEAEALEQVNALGSSNRELLAATGKSTMQEALGVIAAWKAGHEQNAVLAGKLEALETERKTEKLAGLIASGRASGKLTPAMATEWASKQTPEALEAFLAVAPVAISNTETQEPVGNSDVTGVLLTYKGKKWDEMAPMEKAKLHGEDNATYIAMRDQARASN